MRTTRFVLVLAALAATGCGSDGDGDGPTRLAGTIRGQPFTVVEAAFAGPESSDACTIDAGAGSLPYAPSSVLLGFARSPGLCDLLTAPCALKKGYGLVGGLLVHARIGLLGPVTAPPLDPASYPVVDDPSTLTPDATGAVRVGLFSAEETDAACADLPSIDATTGTVTLSVVSASELRGTVDLRFEDGGTLQGPFVAARCPVTYEVCTPEPPACTGTPTCN